MFLLTSIKSYSLLPPALLQPLCIRSREPHGVKRYVCLVGPGRASKLDHGIIYPQLQKNLWATSDERIVYT